MHFILKKKKYGVFQIFFLKKCLLNLKINKMLNKIRKDSFLRKQYKRFETWNKLNKSLKKSQMMYNIPACSLLKKKKKCSKIKINRW